eukprot:m.237682 g.237682  ORF g.237682 m.237682 type:complete len:309 (+) comp33711_c1_seq10:450-1376(+)
MCMWGDQFTDPSLSKMVLRGRFHFQVALLAVLSFTLSVAATSLETRSWTTNATAVLIQPKVDEAYVRLLIARHDGIRRTAWGDQMDHVIFHERATDVSLLTSRLKGARFVPIDNFLLSEPEKTTSEVCNLKIEASLGYRSMCWFWYSTAWSMLGDLGYEFVLRVDDDCILKSAPWPDHPAAIGAPLWTNKEAGWVMNGMTKFFQARYTMPPKSEWLGPVVENTNWHIPASPCTQIMLVHVPAIVRDPRIQQLWKAVFDTNCIYINRWGDLPLWGFTAAALRIPTLNMTGWEYFHGSHHRMVQSGWYLW